MILEFQPSQQDNKMTESGLWGPPSRRMIANVTDTQYDVVLEVCEDILGWKLTFEKQAKDWDLCWTDLSVSSETLSRMKSHQKINHFPGMNSLSRKNTLAKNILKMQESYHDQYAFLPKTWLLPQDIHSFRRCLAQSRCSGRRRVFIVKPEASSQGRGIYITHSDSQFRFNDPCVVQQYVVKPLLYEGLKFDLRVYILVAGCDPLRMYIYNQGLVRFSTEEYQYPSDDNYDNLFMHLTNYSINKKHPGFVQNESEEDINFGHKRSLAQFFKTLKEAGVNSAYIWSQIKDIAAKTLISAQPLLSHQYKVGQPNNPPNNMCFQILGFDYVIQKDEKVFLLEVNHSPSFKCDSPLDYLVKTNLISDTIDLMNINTRSRNQMMYEAFMERDLRIKTGKRIATNRLDKKKLVDELQYARDQFQDTHCGSYQKIFPSPDAQLQQKYEQLLHHSLLRYSQGSLLGRRVISTHMVSRGVHMSQPRRRITNLITQESQQEQNPHARSRAKNSFQGSLPRLQNHNSVASQSPLLRGPKRPNPSRSIPRPIDFSINQFSKGPISTKAFGQIPAQGDTTTMFSRQFRK